MVHNNFYIDYFEKNFRCDDDKRMTDCHKFMMSVVADILMHSRVFQNHKGTFSVYAVSDLQIDNTLPDVYTPFFDVECETGFKHDLKSLKSRILKSSKTVIVVLPNQEIKDRYVGLLSGLKKRKLRIISMVEFPKTVYDVLRSIDRK